MYSVTNRRKVPYPLEKVFQTIKEFPSLSTLLPDHQKVKELERKKGVVYIERTVPMQFGVFSDQGKPYSFRSSFEVDEENKKIYFQELDPVKPVIEMKGWWEFIEQDQGVEISLNHQYDLDVFFVVKPFIAALVGKVFIRKNAQKELMLMEHLIANN
ncbi:MAG: SRPBCC family protein [Proteobacteria bacterium]|nr:SRPBCC family protein [Pseudomonadota bacterium]